MKHRLIITADDYGLCDAVNQAIEECLSAGAVRATCVMSNMPACGAAASLRNRFAKCSIGVHWNLTQAHPLLKPKQVPTLVDKGGTFFAPALFRKRWLLRQINPLEVKDELRAQFRMFSTLAGQPDFWNTHENVHVFPGLFDLFVSLGLELRIPAMRSHRRLTVPFEGTALSHNVRYPLYWLKGRIIAHWSQKAETQGTLMPDGRVYAPGYNGNAAAALEQIASRLPWNSVKKAVELVVHPAKQIQEGLFGSLTESRLLEYEVLRNPDLVKRLRRRHIEPSGFEILDNGQPGKP
jgi:predicted glycoside hydrolase/deacetylase ChbG (UPF0249 family)